jgi:integrase
MPLRVRRCRTILTNRQEKADPSGIAFLRRTVRNELNNLAKAERVACRPPMVRSGYAQRGNCSTGILSPGREGADKRREPHPGALVFYSPEEIEAIARALTDGRHRDRSTSSITDQEREVLSAEDRQDAEIVRVTTYAGLRQGELLAMRWHDVDFAGSALTIARAMGAGVESSTKSGRVPPVAGHPFVVR